MYMNVGEYRRDTCVEELKKKNPHVSEINPTGYCYYAFYGYAALAMPWIK